MCDKLKEKDMTILMGDLNAKIGSYNSGYEEVMGRQGLGKMNENGEMLADFCAFNNMIIGGSVFPHRTIHKATWVSPDHRIENQIDHICIGRKFRRSLQDVRVQRGTDAASDHHLVLARMKMKLKKSEVKRSTRTQYNVDFLKDRLTTETFRLTVRNKYEALQDLLDEGNMDIEHTMATDQGDVDHKIKQIKTNTKLRIFNSNVKAVLLCVSETWRSTQKTLKRIQTFINKCLRRILHLKWTDKISNTTLWKMTKQLPIENEIKKRKWRWIGHTLRKPPNTITRQAITWNPPGKRRRGRPRNTWQRDTEKETKEMGYTRREMEKMATDRKRWRSLVDGLCSQRANRHK